MPDSPRSVTLKVRRSDPERGEQPTWREYRVPLLEKLTVLDALFYVVQNLDSTVSFRCACRAAMCGTCGMVMAGREGLACRTQLAELGKSVTVEPLRNLPVIKDLVVDMEPFFDKYRAVTPYLVPRQEATEPAIIPAGSLVAIDHDYLGPAALNRAYCLTADVRDAAREQRLEAVRGQHGVWRCHSLFECTQVCPKNLIPTRAIKKLKRGW